MRVTEIEPGIFEQDVTGSGKFNSETIIELRRRIHALVEPGSTISTLLIMGGVESFGFGPDVDQKLPRQYVLHKSAMLVDPADYFGAVEVMRRIGKNNEIHVFDDREKALAWLRE